LFPPSLPHPFEYPGEEYGRKEENGDRKQTTILKRMAAWIKLPKGGEDTEKREPTPPDKEQNGHQNFDHYIIQNVM
jgi:hypothetical protein